MAKNVVNIDTKKLARVAEIHELIKQGKANLDALAEEKAALCEELLPVFEKTGINHINVGGKCVYLWTQYNMDKLCENSADIVTVLKASDLEELIQPESYSYMKIGAYIRERMEMKEPLPTEWNGVIGVKKDYDLRVRKA